MKMFLKLLSAFLIIATLFTMFAPSVAAQISIWQEEVNLNKDTEPTYTRQYSFNTPSKDAENDRLLNEDGAWRSDRPNISLMDAVISVRTDSTINSILGTFTSLGTASSSWTIDTSDENYVSIPSITQDHPRLLLTSDKIPTIRKALEEDNKTNNRFFELLDTSMETVDSFKLGTPEDGYDGRTGLHNYRKDYLEIIQVKALGYLVDGHELYGYQAIHGMKQYLASLDIQNIPTNAEREYGNVAFTAALVFDWCHPLLKTADKNQIMAGIQNCTLKGTMGDGTGHKMHCGYPPFWNEKENAFDTVAAVAAHSAEREILRDYLSVAVAFYGESAAANTWWTYISKLIYSQYVPARNYYFRSGISHQGLGVYVSGRHISDMYSAWILTTATGTQPYKNIDKTIRNLLGYETQAGRLFSDGDGTGIKIDGVYSMEQYTSELRSMAYMTAYLFEDDTMLAYAKSIPATKSSKDPYYGGYYGADTIELTSAMYIALTGMADMTPAPEANKYDGMPLIQYNGSPVGQYITHEAYGTTDSASVFMKIKEKYTANHEHLDAGTFMIYYKGMLTADGGVYASYGGAHQRYYHQATVSHNGLLIYDSSKFDKNSTDLATRWYSGGQQWKAAPNTYADLKGSGWSSGKVVGHRHAYTDSTATKPLYAYIAGDITASYPTDVLTDSKGNLGMVGRRMLTVYTGDENVPMVFFTYDTITAGTNTYTQKYLLQIPSPTQPTVTTETINDVKYCRTIKTENGGGQLVLTCINGDLTHNGYSGYNINGEQNYTNGTKKNGVVDNGNEKGNTETGAWGRIELTLPAAKSNKVLNAMYVTDAGTTTYYPSEKITNVSTGGFTNSGIDLDGCVFNNSIAAVFTKKNLKSSSDFVNCTMSFTAPGSGNLSYYVDGLKGGNWIVTVGGNTVGTYKASNGLLTFEAPAGAVTLTMESADVTAKKTELITALGDKISNDGGVYSVESYTQYSEAYEAIVNQINSAADLTTLNAINVTSLKSAAEAKLALAEVPDVISVNVTWLDINFTYKASTKEWDPSTHQYVGEDAGWSDSNGEITVSNLSNIAIDVTVAHKPPTTPNGKVSITLDSGQYSFEAMTDEQNVPTHTFSVTAQGVPENDSGIGSLVVGIKKRD